MFQVSNRQKQRTWYELYFSAYQVWKGEGDESY